MKEGEKKKCLKERRLDGFFFPIFFCLYVAFSFFRSLLFFFLPPLPLRTHPSLFFLSAQQRGELKPATAQLRRRAWHAMIGRLCAHFLRWAWSKKEKWGECGRENSEIGGLSLGNVLSHSFFSLFFSFFSFSPMPLLPLFLPSLSLVSLVYVSISPSPLSFSLHLSLFFLVRLPARRCPMTACLTSARDCRRSHPRWCVTARSSPPTL